MESALCSSQEQRGERRATSGKSATREQERRQLRSEDTYIFSFTLSCFHVRLGPSCLLFSAVERACACVCFCERLSECVRACVSERVRPCVRATVRERERERVRVFILESTAVILRTHGTGCLVSCPRIGRCSIGDPCAFLTRTSCQWRASESVREIVKE